MLKLSIDKKLLPSLPRELFTGEIVVVDNLAKMNSAINSLYKETIVGIDTETRPTFARGVTNDVALIQISTLTTAYLFRVNSIGYPSPLKMFLEDEAVKKVGLSLKDDIHRLKSSTKINPQGLIDLQPFVKDYGIVDNALSRMYAIVFGKHISKSQQLSNWEAHTLSLPQQAYAATDAWACLKIYDELTSGRFVPEDSQYIVKEDEAEV